jgi:flagellar biogenesis protein FliO
LLVPAGLFAAIKLPALFLGALVVFLIAAAWLLPKLFRAAARTFRRVSGVNPMVR